MQELAKLQFEILESASQVLKDGGELVYSTCTILKEENGENIKIQNLRQFNFIFQRMSMEHMIV